MTARQRAALTALLVALLLNPLVPWTGSADAAGPKDARCPNVELAPVLPDDRGSDGRPVAQRPDGRGRWVPVVLVHGFTSRSRHDAERDGAFSARIDLSAGAYAPKEGRSLIGQLQNVPGAAVYTFDYHDWSARWVTDTHLGPALADALFCLHGRTGERAIVVGHSMGGLITRHALAQTRNGRPVADDVSRAITFGTPGTGSLLAAVLGGTADVGAVASPQTLGVLRALLAGCGAVTSTVMDAGTVCDLLPSFVAAADSQAGRALRMGSGELKALPAWPKGFPVTALAGQANFRVPEMGWFKAHPWKTVDVPIGDVVVDHGSATGGSTTQKSIPCAYQLSATRGALDQVGLLLKQTALSDVAGQPLGAFAGACFHNNLMRSIELTNEALGTVSDDIAARDVRRIDWANASIPGAVCEQDEVITFTDGLADDLPPYPGQSWPMDAFAYFDEVDYGDVTGDGADDALLTVECTNDDATAAGRLVWSIVAFSGESGSVRPIGTITGQHGLTGSLPAHLGVAGIDAEGVRIEEAFYGPQDGSCCPSGTAETLWRWTGSALEVVSSDVVMPAIDPESPDAPVATADGFGPVELGMTLAEAKDAVGSMLLAGEEMAWCDVLTYRTLTGDAVAYVHNPEGTVLAIQTPDAARTDRGVGSGDDLADLRAAYARDHGVETMETQAGSAVAVTTGDPAQIGFGNPGGLIGFAMTPNGFLTGAPMVGGVPGFEYCSG